MANNPTPNEGSDICQRSMAGRRCLEADFRGQKRGKQRDQIVAALRRREAVEPFIAFAKAGTFKLFSDDFVLTNGSRQAQRQLTAGDFRALLAAAGEEEA
ncbi:MAG: hypothetical protein ACJ8EL_18890 [Rhizomicrobium sp.]